MSTNNFPLVWNSEADDGLLGSLFPQGNNFNSGPSESTVHENQNPFASSPLSKNGSDLKNHFFIGSKLYNYGNIEIIIDPSSKQNPADKIKIIEQNFIIENKGGNRSLDEGEKAFRVKLFICKDSNQLKTIFDNGTVIPDKNEILLFLEDNSGDWSGTTMYIKKGANVNNSNFFDKLFSKNSEFASFINSQYNISKSDLQELLRKEKVESNTLNLISALFGAVSYLVSSPILIKSIAFGIETAIEAIKKNCSISEKSWNPANTEEGTAFQPLFFIGIPNILDSIDDSKINAHLKEAIKKLKTESNDYHEVIEKSLLMISKTPVAAVFPFPFNTLALLPNDNSFSLMLLAKYRELRKTIDACIDELEKIDFTDIIKQSVYAVNAFICGIWNGFVEAVCGIFSLVQYLFEGAGEIADLLENFKEKGPQLLEQIDNCILKFQELDFGQIFATLASNIKDWALSESTTSIVEMAYFSGMFIGFVIELVVELAIGILFTGGLLTIETLIAKLGETFKALGSLLMGAVKLPFKAAEKTFSSLAKGLKTLYEFLSKGTDEIVKIIDEVFGKFKAIKEEVILIDSIEDVLLSFIIILKKNPSYIKCINLVNADRAFGKFMVVELEAMIKLYTGNAFRILNKALRGIDNIKLDKELKAMQKILDEALEKLPISEYNNQTLQRSAFFTEKEIKKLFKEGKDFVEKGFMSTTYSDEALKIWLRDNPTHNVVFKVLGKNGKLIEEASMLPFESEVLFKSGTVFVVESSKPIPNPINTLQTITEIILKEK